MHNPFFYTNLNEKELAADEYFQHWVLRPDESSDRFWNDFLTLHPERVNILRNARRRVEELAYAAYDMEPLSTAEKQELKQQIYGQLDLQPAEEQSPGTQTVRRIFMRRMAIAAAFIGVIVSTWLILSQHLHFGRNRQNGLLAEHTGPNELKKILLSDSTLVILNANSTIRYNPDFSVNQHREVVLEGNAYFRVRKDAGRTPFTVKANSLSVTVLGTEFNVNARPGSPEVSLASGKIKLTAPGNDHSPVYLLPGDKVRLDTTTHTFTRSMMDMRLYSAWTDGIWNFRQNTLEEITTLLSEYYGVTVVFESQHSRHMRIDAVIKVGSLQKLVPVLAQTIRRKMSLVDDKLIIQ